MMQENPKFARFQRFLGVFLVAVAAFFAGHYFGKSGYIYEIRKNPPKIEIINKTPSVQKIDFDLFWDVWDLTAAQYLLRPVDAKKMLYGAIEGAVRSLGDPYTSFLTPDQNKVVADALNGTYEGIGAELGMKEGQLMVVAPLDGSPAKEFGLLAGDRITQIDGQTTVGITLAEAVAKRLTAKTIQETLSIAQNISNQINGLRIENERQIAEIEAIFDRLVKILEEKFGVSAASFAAAGAATGAAAGEGAAEEKDSFSIILKDAGTAKIQVIKVLRELTGLGLKEAKDMTDKTPATIKEGVKKAESEEIKKKLEEAGAVVELK